MKMKTVECCVYEMQVKLPANSTPWANWYVISFASTNHVHATYVGDSCISFVRPLLLFVRNFQIAFLILFIYLFIFYFVSLHFSLCVISIVYRHNFFFLLNFIAMCRYVWISVLGFLLENQNWWFHSWWYHFSNSTNASVAIRERAWSKRNENLISGLIGLISNWNIFNRLSSDETLFELENYFRANQTRL